MPRAFDVAVIGAGVLGTSVSYWLSALYDARVCVIEAESRPAHHASSRNTGVVHSPFYIDPDTGREMAAAMISSRPMWERLARKAGAAWSEPGVLEVAVSEPQRGVLERHMKWGAENGMGGDQLELLDGAAVAELEPSVKCEAAIRCPDEAATNFGRLTGALADESSRAGTDFVYDFRVAGIARTGEGHLITDTAGSQINAGFIINCAGARSLSIAKMMGQAEGCTALHFRGEYWAAAEAHRTLVGTSVYSVPRYPDYPFLDPHWIVRADGRAEVGPNAVPVAGPESYEGAGGASQIASKLGEILTGSARQLLHDREFLRMASAEWRSSFSKEAMISRIRSFVPSVRADMFDKRGDAGIRTPVVTPEGRLAAGTMEIRGDDSWSIINYNSPGATGAPAYSAWLVGRLAEAGHLGFPARRGADRVWSESDVERQD